MTPRKESALACAVIQAFSLGRDPLSWFSWLGYISWPGLSAWTWNLLQLVSVGIWYRWRRMSRRGRATVVLRGHQRLACCRCINLLAPCCQPRLEATKSGPVPWCGCLSWDSWETCWGPWIFDHLLWDLLKTEWNWCGRKFLEVFDPPIDGFPRYFRWTQVVQKWKVFSWRISPAHCFTRILLPCQIQVLAEMLPGLVIKGVFKQAIL